MQTQSRHALILLTVLAVGATALPAACAEVDNGDCGDGALQAGEECDTEQLNGLDCEALGREPGELLCSPHCTFDITGCGPCANTCTSAGTSRCNDTRVEYCDYGPTQCLAWQLTTDCGDASQICDSSSGTPQCGMP